MLSDHENNSIVISEWFEDELMECIKKENYYIDRWSSFDEKEFEYLDLPKMIVGDIFAVSVDKRGLWFMSSSEASGRIKMG